MQNTGDPGVTSSVRLHRVLLAAAVMVPGLLFGAAAWQNREDVLREGRDAIQRTAAVMQEHGRKVFETAELAIGQVDERIDDHDWERIGAASTSGFLHRLCAPMDQLVSIWIADADGRVRAGSQAWTPGSGIAGRDFFQAQKAADRGTYIGAAFTGAATSAASFAIIRRRTVPGGVFDGTIHAAASPDYFTRFYAEAAPPIAHVALLIRDDGAVLAREPADPAAVRTLAPGTPVMRHLATGEVQAGLLSDVSSTGVPQDYAIRKIGAYPLYVVFAVPRAVLLERWYRNLRAYGAVAAAAALTLLVVSWLALRRAQAEEAALVRLRGEIAQRQAAEQQLRHAQRMDAVGQLTGGIAHDFNNLLTAILGNLELITRAARSLDGGEKVGRLAGTAMKAVQRGSALTKSLLAFSRKQPLLARPMDANALLADFIELVRQAVGGADHGDPRARARVAGLRRRPGGAGSGDPEPGHQRAGRDARRRPDRDLDRCGGAVGGGAGRQPGGAAGAVRVGAGRGHGQRHAARGGGQGVRAVLHHQAGGAGDGAGPQPGVRLRAAAGRACDDREHARAGHGDHTVPAGGGRVGRAPARYDPPFFPTASNCCR